VESNDEETYSASAEDIEVQLAKDMCDSASQPDKDTYSASAEDIEVQSCFFDD
nr:hypothetical protein [Tanacetum cinerariifolium]